MRWVPWALGIAGVVQYAILAMMDATAYVSLDTAYLVMWLAVIGALVLCWIGYGCCDWEDGCSCCDDGCHCGDGDCCPPDDGHGHGHSDGHKH